MDTLLDRFQAVLTVRGAESMFKIVEINDFKQVWERACKPYAHDGTI
jgi:hypothetical protein